MYAWPSHLLGYLSELLYSIQFKNNFPLKTFLDFPLSSFSLKKIFLKMAARGRKQKACLLK
jgi:hypothetical protein